MTNDANRDCLSADAVADLLLEAIETSTQQEIHEVVASRYGSVAEGVSIARKAIADATREAASRRRKRIEERRSDNSTGSSPDTSGMDRGALIAILERHAANDSDAASLTLAARNGRGDLSDAELRSVVSDILRLRAQE